jgi:hypothetical protein
MTTTKALEKLNVATALLGEARAELGMISGILNGLKAGKFTACHRLPPKQGELFSYLPEENKTLEAVCLGSLVETI